MEMELHRQTLEGFHLVFDSALAQEETLECIVPDALPDVARIVSAVGHIFLKNRQAGGGTLRLSGSVYVTVLYIPEGENLPKSMEAELPFQCTKDCPQIHENCRVQASAFVISADARAMNPRKLLIRASLSFLVQVYEQQLREITCDASDGKEYHLEKQYVQSEDWTVAGVMEKSFLFSDVLRPPASRPTMEELLYYRLQLGAAEAKAIGKKLICKGEFHLSTLYRSGEAILNAGFELPFSQIFDLAQSVEDSEVNLSILATGLQCTLQDGELAISVEALAQAVLWVRQPLTVMSDAYCTSSPLDVERAPCTFCISAVHDECRETARQFCESGIPAKQVLDCFASVESIECKQEEGKLSCSVQLHVEALYLSEDDALCGVGYAIPVSCEINIPDGGSCRCECLPIGELTAVPVTGGLEVRGEVLFSWVTIQEKSIPCVITLRQGTVPAVQMPKPSLIIRMVGEGESLWEVAKSCGATIQDIRTANEITDDEVATGTLLLIPTKRS